MRRRILFGVCLAFASMPLTALAQSELPRADQVVKARAYVSLAPVPRGQTFEIAVVAEIIPGFHINANKVLQDYLIPTELKAELPKGFRALDTMYPPGALAKFEFSEEKLAVYEGRVTLRMRVVAGAEAPLGATKLPLVLRYQACNDKTCLPPVRIPVAAELEVGAAGTKPRPAHPEIFSKRPQAAPEE